MSRPEIGLHKPISGRDMAGHFDYTTYATLAVS